MWVLPSRSRPHNIERLCRAWEKTGAATPVELCLDKDDQFCGEYMNIAIPPEWCIVVESRSGLSDVYNMALKRNPDRKWYGFIADDVVPQTNGWDVTLIEAAGANGMSVPDGGHEPDGAPHFVLGGDLVREMGWLSLPGLDRLYIDTVWQTIAENRGVLVRRHDVVLEHRHFSNGKALMDSTYRKHRKTQDKEVFETWRQQNGYLS